MSQLEILKKHLGEVDGLSEFKATQICSQINDANDFIGALQVLDIALKKVQKNISERDSVDDMQKRTLDANSAAIISECSFMGTKLFGNVFNVYVGKQLFEFEIANPLLLLEKNDYEGVMAYIQDKREEVSSILLDLATALTLGTELNLNANFTSPEKLTSLFG